MNPIGKMISEKRKELNLSQIQLAELLEEKTGITVRHTAISTWERGVSEPSVSTFMALCKILGITDIYGSYYGENPDNPFKGLNAEGIEKANEYIELLLGTTKYKKKPAIVIPFRREVPIFENAVSAGTGNPLTDGPSRQITIEQENILPIGTSFGVFIYGNSMEPKFSDGQIAWVHSQSQVEDGEIGIFALNGDAYIKKLQNDEDGLFLISLNPDYPPIPIKENDRLDIFGKVVGSCNASSLLEYAHKR